MRQLHSANCRIDLNDALFPLNYEGPYPITRGIRVETAGIIFLFVLGVMSQMKVWKIIKKRREERAAEETRKNEEKERAEEALGRQLEADNEQERALWDAVYGNKKRGRGSHLDSGIGTDAPSSTRKSSMSVVDFQNLRDEGIEMQDLGDARSEKGAGKITVHVAQDDELAVPSPAPRSPTLTTDHPMEHSMDDGKSTKSAKIPDQPPPNQNMKKAANIDKKLTLKATPKPKFVPLPFNVPQAEKDDDASSAATFAASDHFPDRASKRLSGSLLMRKLSGRSQRRQSRLSQGMSQEALVIPHDDDGASSIAATMDGISNKSRSEAGSSRNPTPEPLASPDILVTAPQTPLASTEPVQAFDPIQKAVETTVPPRGVRLDAEKGTVDRSAREKRDQKSEKGSSETVADEHQTEESISKSKDKLKAAEAPKASQGPKEPASLAENLPQGASRIELAYRTNEWAKHLDRAETPETEEIKIHECQSAIAAQSKEVAAPVNVRGLQQTALTAEPAPETSIFVNDAPAAKNNNPYRPHQPRSNSQMSFVKNLERAPSQTSLVSSSSSQEDSPRSSLNKTRTVQSSASLSRGFRSTSTPLVTSPLATSPIQEDVEATFPPKFTPSASHLMSQRDNLIRSKPSSTSLLRSASANSMNRLSAYNTPNASNMPLNHLAEEDDDNISLAQRKSMLQQNPSRTSLINRTLSSGAVTPVKASHLSLDQQVDNNPYRQTAHLITNNNPPHAARLPKSPTDPAALSSWRASLAQLPFTAETQQTAEIERRRSQLLAEKQAERRSQAVEAGQREQRQSVLGREMRRGSMLDAHREAMRRMQGQVNEKLKQ